MFFSSISFKQGDIMKSKIFIISSIAIIMILTTTFLFINKDNSNKDNLLKDSTNKIESKEKVKQEVIQERTEDQKELQNEENKNIDVVENNKEESKKNLISSSTSTTPNNSNEINQNSNQQNQVQSNNNQVKEEPIKENNNSYIGVPSPNDFNYSFHKGKIEYSSMEACLSASERIALKDTVDIINSWCMDVVDGQGTVLGEYLYINCSSGNCNKYKD